MNVGDMVKFSRDHFSTPGLDYTEEWIGVVVKTVGCGAFGLINEIQIMWTIFGNSHIMDYDESWWNNLDYDPFDVISESR